MSGHSEIMRFAVEPAAFGKATPYQFVDHAIAVVKQLSQKLPVEIVRLLGCNFIHADDPKTGVQTVITIDVYANVDPVEIVFVSYERLMGRQLEELPEVEDLVEKLNQWLLRAFPDWLKSMDSLRTYFSLTVI